MSCYMIDKAHLVYLVQAATAHALSGGALVSGMSWRDSAGEWKSVYVGITPAEKVELGRMLWDENLKSVTARCPNVKDGLPGRIDDGDCGYALVESDFGCAYYDWDPVQVLKACACYSYQACEHEDWEQSEAFRFIRSLQRRAINALPGYRDAAWGAPEEKPASPIGLHFIN